MAMTAGDPHHPWPQVAQAPADFFMRPRAHMANRSPFARSAAVLALTAFSCPLHPWPLN